MLTLTLTLVLTLTSTATEAVPLMLLGVILGVCISGATGESYYACVVRTSITAYYPHPFTVQVPPGSPAPG